MKRMTVSKRLLSFALALLMLVSAFPMLALPAFADGETPEQQPKVWTDEDYAKLYVTDADGDGESDLLFKWDAFDLEAGATVTELVNQVEGGQNITLDKIFNKDGPVLNADSSAVGKVSNGTEKDTVLGDTTAENLVADSAIDTNGAVLTTATLDFSAIAPSHKVGDVTVLDDVTIEMTLFQQNYYAPEGTALKSAATYGPLSSTRFIHDNLTYTTVEGLDPLLPCDESYGFIAHSTFGYSNTSGANTAIITDLDPRHTGNHNNRALGNYRLQTYSVAAILDLTVAKNTTTGTFTFCYARDAQLTGNYPTGNYDARYSGHWVGKTSPAAAHNRFWFGGSLPFAYRALRLYSVALSNAQMTQNHVAELLDYYRADLSYYVDTTVAARKEINASLKELRLGETSKEEIEAIMKPIADAAAAEKVYEDLYVTQGLLFKWDAFDLKAGETVTELSNQTDGANIALNQTFDGANKKLISTKDVSKVSDGTEKNTVLGDTTAENLVADSTIDTNGAVLSTAVLDFSGIIPTHKVGDVTVLDDVTLEMTLFQQNYYTADGANPLKSAATFGPLSNTRFIHDRNDMSNGNSITPVDATYGFIAHSTMGFSKASNNGYVAFHTDNARSKKHVFGNSRLETFSLAVVFDYTVAENQTTGRNLSRLMNKLKS